MPENPDKIVTIRFPYISKMPRKKIYSSDYELIRKIYGEYDSAWAANKPEWDMMFLAWEMAFAAPGEQWDQEAFRYKIERYQRAGQYNLIGPKVDKYAGALIADKYDFKYDPIDGVRNSGVKAIEDAYYCDKERCEYVPNRNQFLTDGVIHVGELELKVSTEYDNTARIVFKRAMPGEWMRDPYWKTDNDRECRKAWKRGVFVLPQLFEQYKSLPKTPELDEAIKKYEEIGTTWQERYIEEMNEPLPKINDTYNVIEYHWIEIMHEKRLIAYNQNGDPIPFPVTEDNEELQHFADSNGITDWQNADIVPYEDKIAHVASTCRELFPYQLIDKGKPEVQVQSLPIIQFTVHRDISGRNKGIPHDLIDPQRDVNYNKSKIQEYLASALGGAVVYDKRAMSGIPDQQRFEKARNDPMEAFGINGDPRSFMAHIADHQPPQSLVQQGTEAVDFMDRISGVSSARESEATSGEPAALFQMRLQMDELGNVFVKERVKRVDQRMAEMYYIQGKITYSDSERRFSSKDGTKIAVLNEDLGDGRIRNKVEDLPRASVTISEAPDSLTKKQRTRIDIGTVLKTIPPELGMREPLIIAFHELIKTADLSQDVMTQLDDAMALERVSARVAKMTEIINLESTSAQSKLVGTQALMQLKQLLAQMGQERPQEEVPEMVSEEPEGLPEQISPPVEEGMLEQPQQGEIAP